MKCDLRLPTCGACIQTGVECCTTDPGIGESVPRGYIYSLQQQVERLEQQIQTRQGHSQGPSHLIPQRDWQLSQEYDYVGSGTSVDLFGQLCRLLGLSVDSSTVHSRISQTDAARECTLEPLLPVSGLDVDRFLTSSLQKELILYFITRVGSELPPILSEQQEQTLIQEANPLLVCNRSRNPMLRLILLSVFAISARLVSRDRHAEYAYLDHICWNEVHGALTGSSEVSVFNGNALDQVRVMCLLIVHQLVGSGQSRISLDLLNAAQLLLAAVPYIAKDDQTRLGSVSQLGLFLSQVEVSVCSHFKRPSTQYQTLRALSRHRTTWLDTCIQISQLFEQEERVTEAKMALVFPQWRQDSHLREQLTPETALIYLSLHPLFTTDLTWLGSESLPDCPCSLELLLYVSHAARSYIEHLFTPSVPAVLCIWMTLERVLRAGFVWVISVVYRLRTERQVDVADLLTPLTRCDHVLSVLVERWKPGLPYYSSWDIVRQKVLSLAAV
ncbi:hypothetical protein BDW59DRAFT_163835 [Aspergillus cavernicola]|uniref:Fungal-specific transcription factor domain-containing protein n=1 Tax=Aspergillus cavernicola TaxID=176166 RepID=A0ABR4I3A8_9EURO